MNVLILSASSKVLLVRSFRDAAAEYGGSVLACDAAADSAALFEADKAFLVPKSSDPAFGPAILQLCQAHRVKLVVPTRDGELEAVGQIAPQLRALGIAVLAPSPAALAICRDKLLFAEFCQTIGLPVARIFPPEQTPEDYPVFARPRTGAGGAGARTIRSKAEFLALNQDEDSLIVQAYVSDQEYTIDVLMDMSGRPVQAASRTRLSVVNGESQKSRIESVDALIHGALRICSELDLVGHNVVQAFYSPSRGANYIEINPRFGGASNLSIVAGLDSPRRILQMLSGRTDLARAPRPIREGLTMLRHSADVLVGADAIAAVPRAP